MAKAMTRPAARARLTKLSKGKYREIRHITTDYRKGKAEEKYIVYVDHYGFFYDASWEAVLKQLEKAMKGE